MLYPKKQITFPEQKYSRLSRIFLCRYSFPLSIRVHSFLGVVSPPKTILEYREHRNHYPLPAKAFAVI